MFPSKIVKYAENIPLPAFRGLRILMMPIIYGDPESVPDKDCLPMLEAMGKVFQSHKGQVVYLTVDQKRVQPGKTHRRPGLHVDGYPHTLTDARFSQMPEVHGIWAGYAHGGTWGGGGGWGGGKGPMYWFDGTGLLTVSSVVGCRAWNQEFQGDPKPEGDCDHLRAECRPECEVVLQPNTLYWMNPSCVHESMPMDVETERTFVRLSLPSKCDWYEGCTPNPLGIKPTGKINRRRTAFMDEAYA